MKSRISKLILVGSLALNALLVSFIWSGVPVRETHAGPGKTEELVPYMALLQHLIHKLGLSVQAKNEPLAAFYLEEIEETANIIRTKFPAYDNMEIASLINAMLIPSIQPLEKSIKSKNWVIISAGYNKLLDSCNDCHGATDHEYIQVTAPTNNPFNQAFATK